MSVATMAAPPDIHSDGPGKTAQVVLWDQGAARQQAIDQLLIRVGGLISDERGHFLRRRR